MFGPRLHSEADQDRFLLKIYTVALEVAQRTVEDDDPDDVVQDIALSCLTKLRNGTWKHEPANFESFVQNLVNDCVIDRLRKRIREDEYDAEHLRDRMTTTPEWMPADRSKDEASMERFRHTIVAKLPEHWRSAYRLVREEGHSYGEAAAILGISAKTVHNYIVESQRLLRDELRKEGIPVAYSSTGGRPRGGRWRCNQVRLTPRYLVPEPDDAGRKPGAASPGPARVVR